MKKYLVMGAAAAYAIAALYSTVHATPQAPETQTTKSVWDGVYTEDQAARGLKVFADQCAKCHGPDMTGGDAPPLAGSEFASDWDDLSVGDLAERLRVSMPQDKPQSLTREQTADLIAAIMKQNHMPAGQAELPPQAEALKQIKYKANKP